MSLRGRVLLALLLVVAAGLIVSDVATYQALQSFLVQKVDAQLEGLHGPMSARILRGDGGSHGPGSLTFSGTSSYAEVRDPNNAVLVTASTGPFGQPSASLPALPAHLPAPPVCADQFCAASTAFVVPARERGGPSYRVHVWTLPQGLGEIAIALPLQDVAETLNRLLLIEALVTLSVLGGAATLGLYLVRIGLKPLTQIEATADAIAGGDLSQRVMRAEPRTEIGRLGLALNTMLGQIETAFREKDASERRLRRFLADASHELRTPLTSIRGYAELFRRGARERPADLDKAMQRIEEEGERMGVLVDELLLLARLDQGRPLERKLVNLATIVGDAVDAARAVEPDRELQLRARRSVVVTGDATRLRQVLDNLLANVRTHTPAGTPARVSLVASNGNAVLEVADQGPGLPPDDRDLIFNRFYRADASRSRDHGGAGLGLSIVDAIVRAHGGHVFALDNEPRGAMLRIVLPLRPAARRSTGAGSAVTAGGKAAA